MRKNMNIKKVLLSVLISLAMCFTAVVGVLSASEVKAENVGVQVAENVAEYVNREVKFTPWQGASSRQGEAVFEAKDNSDKKYGYVFSMGAGTESGDGAASGGIWTFPSMPVSDITNSTVLFQTTYFGVGKYTGGEEWSSYGLNGDLIIRLTDGTSYFNILYYNGTTQVLEYNTNGGYSNETSGTGLWTQSYSLNLGGSLDYPEKGIKNNRGIMLYYNKTEKTVYVSRAFLDAGIIGSKMAFDGVQVDFKGDVHVEVMSKMISGADQRKDCYAKGYSAKFAVSKVNDVDLKKATITHDVVMSGANLQKSYSLISGDGVEVNLKEGITLNHEVVEHSEIEVEVYANGKLITAPSKFSQGSYTLKYKYNDYYFKGRDGSVFERNLVVSGNATVTRENFIKDYIDVTGGGEVAHGSAIAPNTNKNEVTYTGLVLNGVAGSTFTFKAPIDLSKGYFTSASDYASFIKFAFTPEKMINASNQAVPEIANMEIVLTDVTNANKWVAFTLTNATIGEDGSGNINGNVAVRSNSQSNGCERVGDNELRPASPMRFGLVGSADSLNNLIYDFANDVVYFQPDAGRKNMTISASTKVESRIRDLKKDYSSWGGGASNKGATFDGFDSNFVTVTIKINSLNASSTSGKATLVVSKLGDFDFNQESYIDTVSAFVKDYDLGYNKLAEDYAELDLSGSLTFKAFGNPVVINGNVAKLFNSSDVQVGADINLDNLSPIQLTKGEYYVKYYNAGGLAITDANGQDLVSEVVVKETISGNLNNIISESTYKNSAAVAGNAPYYSNGFKLGGVNTAGVVYTFGEGTEDGNNNASAGEWTVGTGIPVSTLGDGRALIKFYYAGVGYNKNATEGELATGVGQESKTINDMFFVIKDDAGHAIGFYSSGFKLYSTLNSANFLYNNTEKYDRNVGISANYSQSEGLIGFTYNPTTKDLIYSYNGGSCSVYPSGATRVEFTGNISVTLSFSMISNASGPVRQAVYAANKSAIFVVTEYAGYDLSEEEFEISLNDVIATVDDAEVYQDELDTFDFTSIMKFFAPTVGEIDSEGVFVDLTAKLYKKGEFVNSYDIAEGEGLKITDLEVGEYAIEYLSDGKLLTTQTVVVHGLRYEHNLSDIAYTVGTGSSLAFEENVKIGTSGKTASGLTFTTAPTTVGNGAGDVRINRALLSGKSGYIFKGLFAPQYIAGAEFNTFTFKFYDDENNSATLKYTGGTDIWNFCGVDGINHSIGGLNLGEGSGTEFSFYYDANNNVIVISNGTGVLNAELNVIGLDGFVGDIDLVLSSNSIPKAIRDNPGANDKGTKVVITELGGYDMTKSTFMYPYDYVVPFVKSDVNVVNGEEINLLDYVSFETQFGVELGTAGQALYNGKVIVKDVFGDVVAELTMTEGKNVLYTFNIASECTFYVEGFENYCVTAAVMKSGNMSDVFTVSVKNDGSAQFGSATAHSTRNGDVTFNGMVLSGGAGEVFTFDNVIDLSKGYFTSASNYYSFISFAYTPVLRTNEEKGNLIPEISNMEIKITDATNPNKWVSYVMSPAGNLNEDSSGNVNGMMGVKSSNQLTLAERAGDNAIYTTQPYRIGVNGTAAAPNNLIYDYANSRAYFQAADSRGVSASGKVYTLIRDLKKSYGTAGFTNNSGRSEAEINKAFEGFDSNYAIVSVKFNELRSEAGNVGTIVVTKLGDYDLTSTTYTTKDEIKVENKSYDVMANAKVNLKEHVKAYNVYDGYYKQHDLAEKCDVQVYKNGNYVETVKASAEYTLDSYAKYEFKYFVNDKAIGTATYNVGFVINLTVKYGGAIYDGLNNKKINVNGTTYALNYDLTQDMFEYWNGDEVYPLYGQVKSFTLNGEEVNPNQYVLSNGKFSYSISNGVNPIPTFDIVLEFDQKCVITINDQFADEEVTTFEYWRSESANLNLPRTMKSTTYSASNVNVVASQGGYDYIFLGYGVDSIDGVAVSASNPDDIAKYLGNAEDRMGADSFFSRNAETIGSRTKSGEKYIYSALKEYNACEVTAVYLRVKTSEALSLPTNETSARPSGIAFEIAFNTEDLEKLVSYGAGLSVNGQIAAYSRSSEKADLDAHLPELQYLGYPKAVSKVSGATPRKQTETSTIYSFVLPLHLEYTQGAEINFDELKYVFQFLPSLTVSYAEGGTTSVLASESIKASAENLAKEKLGTIESLGDIFTTEEGEGNVRSFELNETTYYTALNLSQLDLLALWAGSNSFAEFAGVEIAQDEYFYNEGETDYQIVLSSDELVSEVKANTESGEAYAARELQFFLEDATGIRFKIITDDYVGNLADNGKYISIGNTKLFEQSGIKNVNSDTLGNDGYVIKSFGNTIIIASYGNNGILNGVYGFLQKVMDYEYYAKDLWTISHATSKLVPVLNIVERPDFDARNLDTEANSRLGDVNMLRLREQGSQSKSYKDFEMAGWIGSDQSLCGQFLLFENDNHTGYYDLGYTSWYNVLPSFEAHQPFANNNNFYRTTQLCVSTVLKNQAQDATHQIKPLDELARVIIEKIVANPTARVFMLGINDNRAADCECATCKAMYDLIGKSGLKVLLANALDYKIKEWQAGLEEGDVNKTRDIKLAFFAYLNDVEAPKNKSGQLIYNTNMTSVLSSYITNAPGALNNGKVTCKEDVIVRLAPIETEWLWAINDTVHYTNTGKDADGGNGLNYRAFEEWANYTQNLAVWDYGTNFSDYIIPFADFDSIQANLQYYKSKGVTDILTQLPAHTSGTAFYEYKMYLRSKLMWNVEENVNTLKQNFFNAYYGAGAADMLTYLDYLMERYYLMDSLTGYSEDKLGAQKKFDSQGVPVTTPYHGYIYTNQQIGSMTSASYWPKASIDYIKTLFNSALSKVDETSKEYERLQVESLFYRYVELRNYSVYMTDAELKTAIDEFEKYATIAKLDAFSNDARDGSDQVGQFITEKRLELSDRANGVIVTFALKIDGAAKDLVKLKTGTGNLIAEEENIVEHRTRSIKALYYNGEQLTVDRFKAFIVQQAGVPDSYLNECVNWDDANIKGIILTSDRYNVNSSSNGITHYAGQTYFVVNIITK